MYDAVIAKEACSLETQRFVPGRLFRFTGTAQRLVMPRTKPTSAKASTAFLWRFTQRAW
jgi:hypothetical protein